MGKDTLTLAMSAVYTLIMHMNTQDVNCGGGGGMVFSSWLNCLDCCLRECTLLEIVGCQVFGDVLA